MIEIKNISKSFTVNSSKGRKEEHLVLSSISFKVSEGEFVVIVGPSGCGKSTLLEILAGLQIPSNGEVWISSKRVLEFTHGKFLSPIANHLFHDTLKTDISMVFQDFGIFPWMTTLENVVFALKLRGIDKRERKDIAMEYLGLVGLEGAEGKYPSQLSGGMRQRVGLARALAVKPKIILMDEPFGALDAFTREKLQDDLLSIWMKLRKAIIFITHDITEAIYLADRVITLSINPGAISDIIPINIPRPRKCLSPEIAAIKDKILQSYQNGNGNSNSR